MRSALRRRTGQLTAAALAAAVLGLTGSGAAVAAGKYADAAGDARGASDITNVSVESDSTGQILVTIGFGAVQARSATVLFIDTDANPTTGSPGTLGAEFLLGTDDEGWGFARWTGSDWDWDTPYSTVRISGRGSVLLFSVNARELGATQSFNFWVRSIVGNVDAQQYDDAPDDGEFNYSLAAHGPDIREVAVRTNPTAGPRAGRRFTVTPTSLTLPPAGTLLMVSPKPESYRCSARVGSRALRGAGTGACTFAIPKGAKGKRLTVSLTVTYQGSTKTISFVYRIR